MQFNEFLMMDFYKYRLLGHKPSQLGPKASEDLGSALGLQDTQAAPTPGVCCGTLHREGLGSPPWALRAHTQAVQWSADFLRQDWGQLQVMACAACPYLHRGGISEPVWAALHDPVRNQTNHNQLFAQISCPSS